MEISGEVLKEKWFTMNETDLKNIEKLVVINEIQNETQSNNIIKLISEIRSLKQQLNKLKNELESVQAPDNHFNHTDIFYFKPDTDNSSVSLPEYIVSNIVRVDFNSTKLIPEKDFIIIQDKDSYEIDFSRYLNRIYTNLMNFDDTEEDYITIQYHRR